MQSIKKTRILAIGVICLLFLFISSCNIVIKKKEYVVKFYAQNQLIETKYVTSGSTVIAPKAPDIAGYIFIGWDQETSGIRNDLNINAIYQEIPEDDIDKLQMDLDYLEKQLALIPITNLPTRGYYFDSKIEWVSETTNLIIDNEGIITKLNNEKTMVNAILSLNNSILYIEFIL